MPPLRRRSVQILLFLVALWLVVAAILGAFSGDYARGLWAAPIALGFAFGVVGAVLVVSVLPGLVPQLALMIVARRERFWPTGFSIWNYRLGRRWTSAGVRWRFERASVEPADIIFGALIPMDDLDLRERLIRVWGIMPLASGLAVLACIPLGIALESLAEGSVGRDLLRLLFLLVLGGQALVFVGLIREDVRSPRAIVRTLRAGGVVADREIASVAVNGYSMLDRRPKDYDDRFMRTVEDWLLEVPTAHGLRYMLIRYLTDTEAEGSIAAQRRAILGLETHLRGENPGPWSDVVVWYAAYTSTTAEELARIWSWVRTADPSLEAARIWLRAREKELRGEFDEARSLAQEARRTYIDGLAPGVTLAFEIDQLDRLIDRLPRDRG